MIRLLCNPVSKNMFQLSILFYIEIRVVAYKLSKPFYVLHVKNLVIYLLTMAILQNFVNVVITIPLVFENTMPSFEQQY